MVNIRIAGLYKRLHRREKTQQHTQPTQANRHNAKTLQKDKRIFFITFTLPQHQDSHSDPSHSHPDCYPSSPLSPAPTEALPPASQPLAHAHCSSSIGLAKQPRYLQLLRSVALGTVFLAASGLDRRAKRLRGMVVLCSLRRL